MKYRLEEITKNNNKAVVVGLGRTGSACVKFLIEKGIYPSVIDSRNNPPGTEEIRKIAPEINIHCGSFDEEILLGASIIVVSPGVSLKEPALLKAAKRCIPIIGEIELFAQYVNAPVFAITGSNGKSTVTTLVGEMLKNGGKTVQVGGNLGTPALELLQDIPPDYYVLELSSFQLETVFSLDVEASAILNITEDHMDRYEGMADYAQAKKRIIRSYGSVIIDYDDPEAKIVADSITDSRKVIGYSLGQSSSTQYGIKAIDGEEYIVCQNKGDDPVIKTSEIRIPGRHNISNAMAAIAMADVASISRDAIVKTLIEFPGLPHRTEWVSEIKGVNWYNDSKATNVGATIAAVNGMPGKLVLIMGGDGKGADFSELADIFEGKVKAVVLLGRDAEIIRSSVSDVVKTEIAKDLHDAVILANKLAEKGDTVLLSPACASWDMFCGGYEQRGLMFMQEVRALQQGGLGK